jgi:hypothetical protein
LENAPKAWSEIETNLSGFTELGWTEFGLQTYYSLLNCGFRMRVTGGTGAGVHPVPLGHGRVYVHCKDFSYETWINNLNAGNSFVTQGPLLDVRFNEELPGKTWKKTAASNSVAIAGTIESLHSLKSIDVVRNGEVAKRIDAQPQKTVHGTFTYRIKANVEVTGSGWVALRCFEDLPDNKVSFAHTNPVFIDVEGQHLRPRKDRVKFFVQRMDEEIARNVGVLSDEAVAEFRSAREVYLKLLETAR